MERKGNLKPVIVCEGVSKYFESDRGTAHIVDGISFEVYENELVVLFGPGQCGKTTLLNVVSGLETASKGVVTINDKTITSPGPDRGFVYQNIALFPWLTVMGNVEYGPKVRGIHKTKRRELAQHYIDLVGLQGFENSFPNQLSGGMKQRVGIARAYCNDPVVLFMDEPFSALDAQTRYLMQKELVRVWEIEKKTILFVTNNIEEAIFLADRIILLSNSPATIKREYRINFPRPRDYTAKNFLSLRDEITKNIDRTL